MDIILDNLPIFIPIILLELVLMVVALVHVLRHNKYRFGNRVFWIIIVVVLQIVGPVAYLTIGRSEE